MVAIVVRLKLTLLKNSLRRSIWRTVGMIIGGVYGLGLVAGAIFGIVALRLWAPADIAADVLVLAFALLTGGWLFFSLLVFGVDETVDTGSRV
jgi:ABC-2 type transport system permease protein